MHRFLIASALVVVLALGLTLTLADASVPREGVHVSPSFGSPSTVFVLSLHTRQGTGRIGSLQRYDLVTASAPKSSTGCLTSIAVRARNVRSGTRLRVSLDPRKLGGSWCPGTYHGRIEELQTAVCPHGNLCPADVVTRGILGRFTLHVKRGEQPSTGRPGATTPPGTSPPPASTSPPSTPPPAGTDKTPPTFSGLQSAYYCVGGPVRPAETTPYTLTWQAATDDVTPSSKMVYDIFVANTPGGEDFSHPTWTTASGATTYTTPKLPSEGTYFVVRARDEAGN
jgi:hypothetical protein